MKMVSSNEGPMYRIVTVFCDDRYKWLYIPFPDLEDVGMTPFNFSAFSRIDEKGIYLEEEMDAQIFTEIYEQKGGFRVVLNEIHEEPSALRQKQNNKISVAQKFWEERQTHHRLRTVR